MRHVYYPSFCMICELNESHLKREYETVSYIDTGSSDYKNLNFQLAISQPFCMDFYTLLRNKSKRKSCKKTFLIMYNTYF